MDALGAAPLAASGDRYPMVPPAGHAWIGFVGLANTGRNTKVHHAATAGSIDQDIGGF